MQVEIVSALQRECIARGKWLAVAESCTGGAIASLLTTESGASNYFLGSLVVYHNTWKEQFLGVSKETLAREGAVSAKAIEEMLSGLFQKTNADLAIAVSGILGPSGEEPQKPVGTVFIGVGVRGAPFDVGRLLAPPNRKSAIGWVSHKSLEALWRRFIQGVDPFS